MAQHDYNLANQNGAAFRADLNAALEAIQSVNSGATEPAATVAYMPWADTNAGLWKVRNAADSAWVSVMSLTASRVDTADGTSYDNSGSDLAATNVKDALDELDAALTNISGDYYSTTNILGTVSQSGGAPTGSIIERGSNANGEYVKFADGTQICKATVVLGAPTTPDGSVYSSSGAATWTFPAEFIDTPSISGSDSNVGRAWVAPFSAGLSTCSIRPYRPSSAPTNISALMAAIGRWF